MAYRHDQYEAVVIGCSAGGLEALSQVLPALPKSFPVPLFVVQHQHPQSRDRLTRLLCEKCAIKIKQVDEKETPLPGTAYFAPPNYHMLLELDKTLSLTVDEWVHHSRPSIDVLFETAAETYRSKLIGVLLTGANEDGVHGLMQIKRLGGKVIVQDPDTAYAPTMPRAGIRECAVDQVLPLKEIGQVLIQSVTHPRTLLENEYPE